MKKIMFIIISCILTFTVACSTKTSQLTPLSELPSNYNEENVKADGGIVIEQSGEILEECRPVWETFLEDVEKGKDSTIRMIKLSLKENVIRDISYKDGKYFYTYIDNNELICEKYTYLKGLYGDYSILWTLSDYEMKWDNLEEYPYRYIFMTKKTEDDLIQEEESKEVYHSKEEAMADGCVVYETMYKDSQYVGSYIIENSLPLWNKFLENIENNQDTSVRIVWFDSEQESSDEGIPVDLVYKDGVYTHNRWQSGETQTYTYAYMITWERKTALGNEIEYVLTDYEEITSEDYFKIGLGVVLPEEEIKKYEKVQRVTSILETK